MYFQAEIIAKRLKFNNIVNLNSFSLLNFQKKIFDSHHHVHVSTHNTTIIEYLHRKKKYFLAIEELSVSYVSVHTTAHSVGKF